MSGVLAGIAESWAGNPDLEGELVHVRTRPARAAINGSIDPPLPPLLAARYAERDITELYRHQARAIESIRSGQNTVVVAGTASGKTLCYQAPIVEAILDRPTSSALLIYPTKALAQDQLRSFRDLGIPDVKAATYDGDTPADERTRVRRSSNVVLTNPDMLHVGILPSHERWADFLHRLEFVVVDEMHTLRGIFGTHVAMILRRLRRLADMYGASPTFVFGSATIGNPEELAAALCGLDVTVIDDDSSPVGEQTVALWNPPLTDIDVNRRRSSLVESTDLFLDLVRRDVHTIAFARSRKATELMYRWARERLPTTERDRVAPYRGGYLPEQRRRIEARLFSGQLAGIVATNALELGIDVGGLDAALLTSFPGTIAAFRQQAGRAGRGREESLVTLVGGEDALDQYFMTHPDELFTRPPEAAVINPDNPLVAEAHAACAANERPLTIDDREILGTAMEEAANRLVQAGHLKLKEGRLYWARRQRPAPQVNIRTSGGASYVIVGPEGAIGTLDEERAFRDGHEGAVYLHEGETFVVDVMDTRRREIRVTPRMVDYYTQPKSEKLLEVIESEARDRIGPVGHHYGTVRVETHVVGYQKRKLGTREVMDTVYLDLPPTVFETEGIWFTIPEQVLIDADIDPMTAPGALHAAEHAGIALMPLMAICDRWDIGGLSTAWHPQVGGPTIFIYEAYAGGAGISPVAFRAGRGHLDATVEAIRSCPCLTGCPSCVQSPKCGNGNDPLDKAAAIRLLDTILT
ncbi:MAG: DEAD/DEAH box helicase [Acidimicrobiia bacterium]|nr:DEAD/DEAH box helicase [Acidimicrobiia bacterium]